MEILIFVMILVALYAIAESFPQAKKKKAIRFQNAAAQTCPSCHIQGKAEPAKELTNAPKLLLGIFAIAAWKRYRCTNCGYKW